MVLAVWDMLKSWLYVETPLLEESESESEMEMEMERRPGRESREEFAGVL